MIRFVFKVFGGFFVIFGLFFVTGVIFFSLLAATDTILGAFR